MGQKINTNVYIVIISVAVIITIIFSLIAYGFTEKYAGEIDPVTLKGFINSSLPMVEYTYDSGKTEFSVLSDLKDGIYGFTGIDSSNPIRMMSGSNSLQRYIIENYWKNFSNPLNPQNPDYAGDPNDPKDPILTQMPVQSEQISPSESGPAGTSAGGINTQNPGAANSPPVTQNPDRKGNLISGPIYAKGNVVTVRNGSNLNIDINKILKEPFYSKFEKGSGGPQILIYHTHTTECYLKSLSDPNNSKYDSHSADNTKTVVRVGHELDTVLTGQFGFNVIQNTTVHDYNYNESYNNSSVTVRNELKGNPGIKLTIDLHRDAGGTEKFRVVQNVKGENCAKVMFVVGSDENTPNPNWEDNLRLSVIIAEKLEHIAPGLVRYISIRSDRYNEHIAPNGLLIEFGGDGNTIDDANASAKYVAQAIDAVFKN